MNLRNIAIGVSMMSALCMLGCSSNMDAKDLKSMDEFKNVLSQPTLEHTEKLVLAIKDNYSDTFENSSLMSNFAKAWYAILRQEATLDRNKQLATLYSAGRIWVVNTTLDINDVKQWVILEKEAEVRGIQVVPLQLDVVKRAMELTAWNLKKETSNKSYRYEYDQMERLLKTNTNACGIKNMYPQLEEEYKKVLTTVRSLNGTVALEFHSGKGSMPDKKHIKMYTEPFQNLSCDSNMSLT